ncbi:isoaspartyl peptidase/L-asparaginase family protein [Legionella israelensis]|uniref:Isoaspartyl peptidase n=1 Tax=Legionella israelensis TaxID=454 RepID=A0A0W0WM93_9GAMM|nr:isoaspartyl peptidase/L-asparaginase [Legionella israelensis]KTD33423.1 isoaspartyl dipeptidase with L-asparaginase activity [Legionella israelensis]QBS09168.1 isoaspartyl peptidase/L-asparaginase [Legionella israelensis]SCY29650.1 beta-aspartyl-peptidase (threonine type) [Legionella israelensis DSM 19235]STX58899.1 isoaspartyl dipeptidase with L-asparaginase activity [Legionella israelensis]
MNNIAIAIHGGASEATSLLKSHLPEYEKSLKIALEAGYEALKKGESALNAVEASVRYLEDDPLFNAGRGSVLNQKGEVEMDASIMDGQSHKAGAVSMLKEVKNPVSLARKIMSETQHVLLSGYGALELAKYYDLELQPESYFITEYQYETYLKAHREESMKDILAKTIRGTVGAVALDKEGNLAAATSTGGTSNCLPGRVGDSCIIGAGCYADNNTCAISGTGEGEALITGVVAHSIAMLVELKQWPLQKACEYVIHERNKAQKEIGVIALNAKGEVSMAFNTEIMKRASVDKRGKIEVKIY